MVGSMKFALPESCAHEAAMIAGQWVDVPPVGWYYIRHNGAEIPLFLEKQAQLSEEGKEGQ